MSSKNQLIIWQIPLDISEDRIESLISEMSEAEIKQASRFRFAKHRRRYVAAHVAMRKILAEFLEVEGDTIVFSEGEHGKPYIKNHPVYFNLSHSEELALLAVSRVDQVGIDLEYNLHDVDIEGIAKRYFHAYEYDQLKTQPDNQKLKYFYQCWTAKEAVVKTQGAGLLHCLDNFAINFTNGEKEKCLWLDDSLQDLKNWFIHFFEPAENYVATVACKEKNIDLIKKQFLF